MVVTRFVFTYQLGDGNYLLINSLSGAVDIVEENIVSAFAALRRGEPWSLDAATADGLAQRGYLHESRAAEQQIVDRVAELTRRRRQVEQSICFVLCPTMTCNLRCPYCFEPHKLHEKGGLMTTEQVEQAFAALDTIRASRDDIVQASVNLFGGEPLLPNTRGVVAQ